MKQKIIRAVDLFCGAGGASTGLVRACNDLGLRLDLLAINHWPIAIDTHSKNHPHVRHLCESVEKIDPREVVPGGRLNLLLAGPECTHFSTARGGRPVNPQSRASAWHILKWAQEIYIDTILIENVPEFRSWGPIGANHKPLKSKRGETYRAFLNALRSLGYIVEDILLNAADFGDPTTRRRLFIQASRGRRHVLWPQATHAKGEQANLFGDRKKYASARDHVIDWSIKGKSIFHRKKSLKPATIARIIAGLKKFGGPELQPFIIAMEHGGRVCDIDNPLPTITTAKGGAFGVAQPFLVQFKGTHENQIPHTAQDVNDPVGTLTGSGADFGVVEPFLLHTTHGGRVGDVDNPVPTVTGARRGEIGIVEPFVLQQQSGGAPRSTDDPVPTIATGGAISLIEPFIVPHRHFDQERDRVDSVDDPLRTITAAAGRRFGLAEPFLVPMYGERDGQEPRTHSVDAPVPTIPATGGGKFGVVEPFLITAGGPEGQGRNANSVDEPMPTVLAENHRALIEPFVISAGGPDCPARSVEQPLGTVLTRDHRAVVEPFLSKYYSNGDGASPVSEPAPTVTTKDRFGLVEPFICPNNTNNTAKSVDDPVPTVTGANRLALVQPIINGYVLDIHFRMLQPHELAAAMSFPKEYIFTGTREDVVKQIGNAWPGELSKALCKAVLEPLSAPKPRKKKVA